MSLVELVKEKLGNTRKTYNWINSESSVQKLRLPNYNGMLSDPNVELDIDQLLTDIDHDLSIVELGISNLRNKHEEMQVTIKDYFLSIMSGAELVKNYDEQIQDARTKYSNIGNNGQNEWMAPLRKLIRNLERDKSQVGTKIDSDIYSIGQGWELARGLRRDIAYVSQISERVQGLKTLMERVNVEGIAAEISEKIHGLLNSGDIYPVPVREPYNPNRTFYIALNPLVELGKDLDINIKEFANDYERRSNDWTFLVRTNLELLTAGDAFAI